MKKMRNKLASNQKGMVSIIVTMVLIILMTLVVLAMSQNANREQRQALDRQLSDQAFYNAESGINDWANYLYNNTDAPAEKTDCDTNPATGFPGTVPDSTIGTDGTNRYTCIIYDKAPKSLEFQGLSISDSVVTAIEPYKIPGNGLRKLKFEWSASDKDTDASGCTLSETSVLPKSLPASCNLGGIRIDIVNPGGSRSDIINNNFSAFLLPSNSGGTLDYSPGSPTANGVIARANCSTGKCELIISFNGGDAVRDGERVYLHMKSLYNTNDVTLTGCHSSGASCNFNPTEMARFNSSQIMLDSTGRANDVLRRIQVRLPAQSQYDQSGSFAIKTTQSICKLITVNATTSSASLDSRCNY